MRVLIVEDEPRLAANIARCIREECGYAVDVAHDGDEGVSLARDGVYDAVILDLLLPRKDGEAVLRELRTSGNGTPTLMLTALDDKRTISRLLLAGADDYLTKPFDMGELLARLQAVVRRSKGRSSSLLRAGDIELNAATRKVSRAGRLIDLTPIEYRILEYLLFRSPAVVSKTELSEHLFDHNWERFSNVIEVHVSGLRKKLDLRPADASIRTVRGHGYSIAV